MPSRVVSSSSLEEGHAILPHKIANQSTKLSPLRLFLLCFSLGVGMLFLYLSMYTSRYVVYRMESRIQSYDNDVFRRASLVPNVKGYSFKRTPKIAFMFLTRGPLPLAPLWDKFFKGNEELFSIYIHSLPSYQPDFPPSSPFYGRQIPSQVAEWGMMSMCDAERRLLGNALLDISNEWFVLVSESCIPLRNFSTVYKYISESQFSFIGAFDEDGPNGRGRYNRKMSPVVNLSEWRKGSQWFEINRRLAIDIVQDTLYYTIFDQYCKPACYVDEHYFPTMLSMKFPHLLANRSVTWVDWSRGGPHPATFGKGDVTGAFLEQVINGGSCMYNNRPTNLCSLFARKFAPSALDILLENSSKFFGF